MRYFLFFFFLYTITFAAQSKGYVYVLENPSVQGVVKIGCTKHISRRIDELYTTGVVQPYKLCFAKEFSSQEEAYRVEQALHKRYAKYRVSPKREFFDKIILNKVKQSLKSYKGRYISLNSFERTFLSSYGLNPKEKLFFKKNQQISVTILPSFRVRYNGVIYSLRDLSSKLLGREIKYKELAGLWCSSSGTLVKDLYVLHGGL